MWFSEYTGSGRISMQNLWPNLAPECKFRAQYQIQASPAQLSIGPKFVWPTLAQMWRRLVRNGDVTLNGLHFICDKGPNKFRIYLNPNMHEIFDP